MSREHEPISRPPYRVVLGDYQRLVDGYLAEPSPEQLEQALSVYERLLEEFAKPGRFELGRLVQTPGAQDAIEDAFHTPVEFLLRHKHGDWGDLDHEDLRANDHAMRHEARLLSAYRTRTDVKLWVITEWDRSATTLLLPSEY